MGWGKRTLSAAVVALLAVQIPVVAVRLSRSSTRKLGPAAATHPTAPAQNVADLLVSDPPAGFAPIAGQAHPLDEASAVASSADPAKVKEALQVLGFRGGFVRSWFNPAVHQFVIAVIGEYRSPGAAAEAKQADERLLLAGPHSVFEVSGVPGAVGISHTTANPGKAPQKIYSVVFRVDRWVFDMAGGVNTGLRGSVDPAGQLAQQVTSLQYAKLMPVLGTYFTPAPNGGHLVVADPVCKCSVTVPAAWDVLPYDEEVFAALVSGGHAATSSLGATPPTSVVTMLGHGFVLGAQSSVEGDLNRLVVVFRLPQREAPASATQLADGLGLADVTGEVDTVVIPAGRATRLKLTVPVTLPGESRTVSIAEEILILQQHGWTYIVLVAGPAGGDSSVAAAIEQSVRLSATG